MDDELSKANFNLCIMTTLNAARFNNTTKLYSVRDKSGFLLEKIGPTQIDAQNIGTRTPSFPS